MKLITVALFISLNYLFVPNTKSCVGKWTTFDDETHKNKSTVELYKVDGKLFGKIVYLYPKKGREDDPLCTKCTGTNKNKKIVGMQIAGNMVWNGKEWEDGYIIDPENGKSYTVSMWIDSENPDKLHVRGYIGIFYRTQDWIRTE